MPFQASACWCCKRDAVYKAITMHLPLYVLPTASYTLQFHVCNQGVQMHHLCLLCAPCASCFAQQSPRQGQSVSFRQEILAGGMRDVIFMLGLLRGLPIDRRANTMGNCNASIPYM